METAITNFRNDVNILHGQIENYMKREVSILLVSINLNEPFIPIGVMESADENILREIIKKYIISNYAWGDEQGKEIDNWVDEIVDDVYYNSEYTDTKMGSELRMSLYSTLMYLRK